MKWLIVFGLCMILLIGCTSENINKETNYSEDKIKKEEINQGITFIKAGNGTAEGGNVTLEMDISVVR